MPTLTSDAILRALNAARAYGHIIVSVTVPRSYDAPRHVDGVCVEPGDVDEPTITTVEGARLDFHRHAIDE